MRSSYGPGGRVARPTSARFALEILAQEREHDRVGPVAVAQVRASLDALTYEPGALRVRDRALVERVALELEPMEAELEDQIPLEQPRGLVGDSPATETRVDGEPLDVGDPVVLAHLLVAHHPCPRAADPDDEAAE